MSVVNPGIEAPILSLVAASAQDKAALEAKLERERLWYEDAPRFQDGTEIGQAIDRGALVHIDDDDGNIHRIGRFRSATPVEGYVSFLTPTARRLYVDFGNLYRTVLEQEFGIDDPRIRLAATSMARTQQYQDRLVAVPGKLASADSRHCNGVAFDVDVSAYYRVDEQGNRWSYSHPRRKVGQIAIGQQLEQQLGELAQPTFRADDYSPAVTEAAVEVAEHLHATGAINLVKEFMGTPNACLHIAVNPDY